jgi:hypothetical protein
LSARQTETLSLKANPVEGTGEFMRHVKLWPERDVDATTLMKLIETAYADMKARLKAE